MEKSAGGHRPFRGGSGARSPLGHYCYLKSCGLRPRGHRHCCRLVLRVHLGRTGQQPTSKTTPNLKRTPRPKDHPTSLPLDNGGSARDAETTTPRRPRAETQHWTNRSYLQPRVDQWGSPGLWSEGVLLIKEPARVLAEPSFYPVTCGCGHRSVPVTLKIVLSP